MIRHALTLPCERSRDSEALTERRVSSTDSSVVSYILTWPRQLLTSEYQMHHTASAGTLFFLSTIWWRSTEQKGQLKLCSIAQQHPALTLFVLQVTCGDPAQSLDIICTEGYGKSEVCTKLLQNTSRASTLSSPATSISLSTQAPKLPVQPLRNLFP